MQFKREFKNLVIECLYYSYDCNQTFTNESNLGGARGVMVIVVGNGHGDMSSNPGQDWLHFT